MKNLQICLLILIFSVLASEVTSIMMKTRTKTLNPMKRAPSKKELENLKPKIDSTPRGKQKPHSLSGAKPAIIGGDLAKPGVFPWMTAMQVDSAWFCGGSVISKRFVLTAGHCVIGAKRFALYMGALAWKDTSKRITFTSTKVFLHPGYDDVRLINDIAIIQLKSPILDEHIITGRIVPIRLPSQTQAKNEVFVNELATVSGWGMVNDTSDVSELLNVVSLKIITNAECLQSYGEGEILSSMLCTSGADEKNICSGDSGSSLHIAEMDALRTQIGIVSFGSSASCFNHPSGFTRVSSFLGWISRITKLIIRK